jgi:hypothetical protein
MVYAKDLHDFNNHFAILLARYDFISSRTSPRSSPRRSNAIQRKNESSSQCNTP